MAAEDVITFHLSDFCDHFDSDEEFVETIDLPKEVLEAIDQNIQAKTPATSESQNDDAVSLPKKSRFAQLQDEEFDEIAHKTNTKQTHAQTR